MRGTLINLQRKYRRQVAYVYRHLPIPSIHAFARPAAEASECAAEQGRFWPYHDLLFENASSLSSAKLLELGMRAGLADLDAFKRCVREGRYARRVDKDMAAAESLGINGTPAVFIGRDVGGGMMEGDIVSGAQSMEAFEAVLQKILARVSGRSAGLGRR